MAGRAAWSRVLGPLLLAAGSLLVCALAGEIALRIAWKGYYEKFDPDRPFGRYDFHPVLGHVPGAGIEFFDWNREFQVTLRHNSLGFRGPEIELEKEPGTTRLLVLGDSMTYGTGIENDETYCAVLDAMNPDVEVINTAVPAYHGGHQLLRLQEWIGRLRPDVVLVAYFWNDLWGAWSEGEPERVGFAHFELQDGELVHRPPDPPTQRNPQFDVMWRRYERNKRRYGSVIPAESYLYRFLSDRFKILGYKLRDWRGERTEVEAGGELNRRQEEEAWQLSYALLRRQREVAEAHGAKFVILVVPDQVQVEPDVDVMAVPPVLPHIQERIRSFAEAEGIPLIEPLETMRAIREREGVPQYHRIDRHWSAVGHRHMAEVLDRELHALGLLPPRGAESDQPAAGAPPGPASTSVTKRPIAWRFWVGMPWKMRPTSGSS